MTRPTQEPASELIRAKDLEGFDLWALPSFDPEQPAPEPEPEPEVPDEIEEVPLEEVQPLTLEELESIRQEAYNEGFATGEKEGFHSTQLKVRQEAETALAAKLRSLEKLMSHLLVPIAEQDSQIEKVLREALKLLPMGASNIRIFVNPQDFEQIKSLREKHEETWKIQEDDALQPGGCRIETEHSRIDATIETRITQAIAQLFDQMHEQALHPTEADVSVDLSQPDAP